MGKKRIAVGFMWRDLETAAWWFSCLRRGRTFREEMGIRRQLRKKDPKMRTPHVRKMPGSEAGPVRKMAGSLIPCSLLYGKGKEVSAERRCQLDGFMLCYA